MEEVPDAMIKNWGWKKHIAGHGRMCIEAYSLSSRKAIQREWRWLYRRIISVQPIDDMNGMAIKQDSGHRRRAPALYSLSRKWLLTPRAAPDAYVGTHLSLATQYSFTYTCVVKIIS